MREINLIEKYFEENNIYIEHYNNNFYFFQSGFYIEEESIILELLYLGIGETQKETKVILYKYIDLYFEEFYFFCYM